MRVKNKPTTMEFHMKAFEPKRIAARASTELPAKRMTRTKMTGGSDSALYTAVCPLVYVFRIFGLAPYQFHNDMLIPSTVNSIYAYVCIAVYTYIMYTVLVRFENDQKGTPLLGHTETAKAVCNYLTAIFDIVSTIFAKDKFAKIWNVMQDHDEIVNNLGYPRSETKTCIWTWIILCTNILVWLAVHKSGVWAFEEPWLQNFAYLLIYIGTSVSIIKFSGLAMMLGQRFDHLNVIARKSGPLTSGWMLTSPIVDSKDIEDLHNSLMLASESLDSLYSWALLLWLSNLSMDTVSNLYFMSQRIIAYEWSLKECQILSCLGWWIVAFLGQLVLLNFACHFAASKANCMGYIMINWRRWLITSSRNRYESIESSIHLINRRLGFSAAGCFYVNLPLLRAIAGLLTTYLVILLQFPQ